LSVHGGPNQKALAETRAFDINSARVSHVREANVGILAA
jgi:hypothetical protein